MESKRSLGINIYAYLIIVMAALSLLVYASSSSIPSHRIVIIISNIFYICIGIGLLKLKSWARISFIGISWIFIILFLLILFMAKIPRSAMYLVISGLFIYLFGIYYFTQDRIKKQFK